MGIKGVNRKEESSIKTNSGDKKRRFLYES